MNQPYDQARSWMLTAALDWPSTNLGLFAWGGTPNFVKTDGTVSQIVARGVTTMLGYSQPITQKAVTADGTARTNHVLIEDIPIGMPVTHFTMCKLNVAVPNLSDLIFFTDEVEGLPFDPNGLDLLVTPDWLQNRGWFRA